MSVTIPNPLRPCSCHYSAEWSQHTLTHCYTNEGRGGALNSAFAKKESHSGITASVVTGRRPKRLATRVTVISGKLLFGHY